MNIQNYLIKHGYRPDLSDGIYDKYERALANYLGKDRYDEFFNLRKIARNEEDILRYAGNDLKLIKLILSSQISISIGFSERIISILKNIGLAPNGILDLGGSDGWAANFIREQLKLKCPITVVDKNELYTPVGKGIDIVYETYSDFEPEQKYDLIISILGAPNPHLEELYACIQRSLSSNGVAILGLRIPNERSYLQSIEIADQLDLEYDVKFCDTIKDFDQRFPVIFLRNNANPITNNEKLKLTRKGCLNYSNPKRVYGFEAQLLNDIISKGEKILEDIIDFDDGAKFTVELYSYNEVLYRVSFNSYGDIIIEYPVNQDDEENEAYAQVQLMSRKDLFNNSL